MPIIDSLLSHAWAGKSIASSGDAFANRPSPGSMAPRNAPTTTTRPATDALPFGPEYGLTPRESQVLSLAINGRSNHAIAVELGIEQGTVKHFLTGAFRKLNVSSRYAALVLAWRLRDSMLTQETNEVQWRNWFSTQCRPRRVRSGCVLFRKGDAGDNLYLLNDGEVALEGIDSVIKPGDVFGEIAVFAREQRRTSTAVCTSNTDLLCLSSGQAKQLYYSRPDFAFRMLRLITSRLLADSTRRA